MKKLFLIFSVLFFSSTHCRVGTARFLRTMTQKPLHAIIVKKAARRIPYSALMQKLLQERTHAEIVLRAAFLSPEQIEDLILHVLLHVENKGASQEKADKIEAFMRTFIAQCQKARYDNYDAFDTARKARNFWGRYHYNLYTIKT